MIKLYYSPFSCSMSVHIVLELVWADYEAIKVKPGSDEYKQIAPKWAVPAIIDDENDLWLMTQIPALLKYIAKKYNSKLLWENSLTWEYKLNNALSFVNSDLHTSFNSIYWAPKFTTKTDEDSINAVKEAGQKRIERQLWFLNEMLEWKEYLVWDDLTIADIYAFVVSNWANFILPKKLENFPNILKLHEKITNIDAVKKIIWIHSER
jgi:glutathione S-transferase